MRSGRRPLVLPVLASVVLAAACGADDAATSSAGPATAAATESATESVAVTAARTSAAPPDEAAPDEEATTASAGDEAKAGSEIEEAAAGSGDEEAAELAAWQQLPLVDVDGNVFSVADFVGTPVFVENFATWCPTCRKQLRATNEAAATVGSGAIFLALSVETDLSAADVADYAADNGFEHLRFAVMTPEFLAAMTEGYGNTAANPPSTPHLVVDRRGRAGELITGSESADAIVAAIEAAAS